MVATDIAALVQAFPNEEEREFLLEMVTPELHESAEVLDTHNREELSNVDDLEVWTNIMGRQNRRLKFIRTLYECLEGSLPND